MNATGTQLATVGEQGTVFSPGECGLIEKALEVAQLAATMAGMPFGGEEDALVDAVRLKAATGAVR
jgi:hypothetical protein